MTTVHAGLTRWNMLDEDTAGAEILPCCGSLRWSRELAQCRPIADEAELLERSDTILQNLAPSDWEEIFRSHPRIGERRAVETATPQSAVWSHQEQSGVDASNITHAELERANCLYEQRFKRIFLVCAAGKSAAEILSILERRIHNDPQEEWLESVEQQRQITRLRLRKWLDR